MRVVDRPVTRPMHCAAIPHRGQTAEGERWVDTGAELPGFDNHVYLSQTAVLEAGRVLGLPSPKDFETQRQLAEAAEEALTNALQRIAVLEKRTEAIDLIQSYVDAVKAAK